jgi:hypothetical protein
MHDLSRLEKLEVLVIALMMALGLAVHIAQTVL